MLEELVVTQRDALRNMRISGVRVRELRERENMTQVELAKELGKSQPYISRMELVPTIDVPLPVLNRLARILRVPLLALLEGVELERSLPATDQPTPVGLPGRTVH